MNLFSDEIPTYVTIKGDHFDINGHLTPYIRVMIQRIQPVRKYFKNGQLHCYSIDAKSSTTGKYCLFCDDKYRCQKKLRLSMLNISHPEYLPIILDINQASFKSLKTFIEKLNDDENENEELYNTPVTLKIIYNEQDYRSIEFYE